MILAFTLFDFTKQFDFSYGGFEFVFKRFQNLGTRRLKAILSNENIFDINLGVEDNIEEMFKEMIKDYGAMRSILEKQRRAAHYGQPP